MKNRKALFCFIVITVTLLTACPWDGGVNPPPDTSTDTPGDIGSFFWGSWVRMDGVNEEWYVSDSGVAIGSAAKAAASVDGVNAITFSGLRAAKETENLLKVTPSGADSLPYYLFRKSGATASVDVGVAGSAANALGRGISGLSGIKVIIRNLKNPQDKHEGKTGSDGIVGTDGVIVGDSYTLEVPVQEGVSQAVTTTVTPAFSGENLGFITVGEAAQNFKVSYAITGNPAYLYSGQSYTLTIKIKNIGTADMLSADYAITQPEALSLTGQLADILGTVRAGGGEKLITLTMQAAAFSEAERLVSIPVRVTSVDGQNEWNDAINLRFFRGTMSIHVRSVASEVQGILISPDRTSIPFKTSGYSGSVIVPRRTEPYILALSGAN